MKNLGIIPLVFRDKAHRELLFTEINGKSILRRTVEQIGKNKSIEKILLAVGASEDKSIADDLGCEVVNIDVRYNNNAQFCAKAYLASTIEAENLIILPNNEPLIYPQAINTLTRFMETGGTPLYCLVRRIQSEEELFDTEVFKVVLDTINKVKYISRSPIPYVNNVGEGDWLSECVYYKTLNVFGVKASVVRQIAQAGPSHLETAEEIEALRFLDYGMEISALESPYDSAPMRTPEDVRKVQAYYDGR